MNKLANDRYIYVSKACNKVVRGWQEGIKLRDDTNATIEELMIVVAADRWRLASQHKRHADLLMSSIPLCYRSSISRYYYAMYHALRACTYVSNAGDDHQEHKVLPSRLPDDLPLVANWQNVLKDARETRNRADYDPYPTRNISWRSDANRLQQDAHTVVQMARVYLRSKGCTL